MYARQPDQRCCRAGVVSVSLSWYQTPLASRGTAAGSRSSSVSGNSRASSAAAAAWRTAREPVRAQSGLGGSVTDSGGNTGVWFWRDMLDQNYCLVTYFSIYRLGLNRFGETGMELHPRSI